MLDLNKLINDAKASMQKSVEHLEVQLGKIRA
jgi:ribosome recycling factor